MNQSGIGGGKVSSFGLEVAFMVLYVESLTAVGIAAVETEALVAHVNA